jgi:plastocyanin
MDKRVVVALVVVVVLVVAGGAYVVIKNQSTSSDNMPNMSTSSSSNSGSTTPTATDKVTIQNFAFSPTNITIAKGTTVTWTNKDSTAHTVTETDGKSGPNSGDVNPGSSYMFTFSQPGTYSYHCSIHPEMTGTVTVTE